MAIQRKEKKAGGAPEWLVTYGDMVTLLLTFFVLLLTFMEPIKEERIQQLMQSLREAFGYQGGVREIPSEEIEIPRNVPFMTMLMVPIRPEDFAETEDDGPKGRYTRVTQIRPDDYYQPGGRFDFTELSAALNETEVAKVLDYANRLRGYTTQIVVQGHCNRRPVDGTEFRDHFDLSWQRARAVAETLIAGGVEPERILIQAAGTARPIRTQAYDEPEREKNDLVEIYQIDKTSDDFRD